MSISKKIDDFVENIISTPLEDIVAQRFGAYSKYIIQDRALPDARDGLKPVQRRILYAMQQLGMFHNKPYKKSARIAGEVMGKYHPHGDSSIYEAMVRLSQDFKMRSMLIDMHGNNGSIDGDSAAAMRYTEARLSLSAELLLQDIDKRTVPFIPNFDDEELEPTVLPAKFPNLLVNGAAGISAGYATKIPPHNLVEVVKATIAYIDNENISINKILKYIQGPDFPTGGIVQGKEGIRDALTTGSGKVMIRAKAEFEEMSKSQERIVITEIPFEVNKADLVKSMDMLRIDKKIDDILEIRDESDQQGLRIAIDLKKGANAKLMLNILYKSTDLQTSYNYNMVTIMNHRPVLVGALPIIKAYVDHQKDVITNRSNYELEKAMKREHIVEGLIKMVSIVGEIIKLIRASNNKKEAKENIIKAFDFTELQAEAIVTLQLYRLSNTDILALQNESDALSSKINELNSILADETILKQVIKSELQEVVKLIGNPRKSVIEDEIQSIKIDEKDLVSEEMVAIGISKEGYIKRASTRSYQATSEAGMKQDDVLIYDKETNTLDTLLIFTNKGNYIYLPVYKIEEQKWKDLGVYIGNITPIASDESIVDVLAISDFNEDINILLASKNGMMKQSKLSDFQVSRYNKCIRAMKIQPDDALVSIDLREKDNIIALSKKGYLLRMRSDDLPSYGLQAGGVKGMSIADSDQLVAARYAYESDELACLTSRGHVITDVVAELPLYNRNRRGILIIDHLKSNPHDGVDLRRLSKAQIKEQTEVLIISETDKLITTANDLKGNYNKFGKKMIDTTKVGIAEHIYIEEAKNDEPTNIKPKKPVKQSQEVQDILKAVKEEAIETKDKKKIHISRFDLFDDENE
ncbi:DNA topoisomerase IV subunit A [Mycoplasmatota bacterium]|nr:DNA topoisomerase IV subunit A [Mycoplasmatota bacterium]